MRIPISKPSLGADELTAVVRPLVSGWVVQGPEVLEFERLWGEFTGARNSIAVSNCTTALTLSLAALGIGTGDEVIVPSFTWVASANSIASLGATPVLCDIDSQTLNIDCDKLPLLLSSRTKAIMPVHLFGLPVNMESLGALAAKHGLYVIEDAACGFAARLNGRHVGTFGTSGCFSFHPRKAITTGEGGIITTEDDSFAAKLRSLRDHGAALSDHARHIGSRPYELPEFPYRGYNFRLTDIQASIGVSQMRRAEEITSARTSWAHRYLQEIASIPWLIPQICPAQMVHGYQAFVCWFKPEEITAQSVLRVSSLRNRFMDFLNSRGIASRPGTHAIHCLEHYRKMYGFGPMDYPVSYFASLCTVTLPLYPSLGEEEFTYVIDAVRSFNLDDT